jgi:subtilase family serine protease
MAAMASLAAIPLAGVTAASASAATTTTSRAVPATLGYHGKPLYVKTSSPHAGLFSCQAPASATNPVPCYGPSQIRNAYVVPKNLDGSGETIAIIDAFGDPYIASDLALFDSTFGLPAAHLNIICVASATSTGPCPTFDPSNGDQVGWAGEIALDTQWSHAIAPGATIDLVIAKSDQDADILAAQQYTISHNLGDVLSQSFGEWEVCLQNEGLLDPTVAAFQAAQAENMSVFASAGDQGAAAFNCPGTAFVKGVNLPASDPLVTSVGGTHLNANYVTGTYQSETVWNNSGQSPDFGAGGGGFSTIFPRPSYQNSAATGSAFRGVPDVTYSADVYNGVLAACTACNGGVPTFFIFGGTSAGSPQWAAITALADQAAGHRLGFLNPTLYNLAASAFYHSIFHDVTVGNNSWDLSGVTGYSAHIYWDPASGLGSPYAISLIHLLAAS